MDSLSAEAIGRIVIADRDARQRVACLEQTISDLMDQLKAVVQAADTMSFNTGRFSVAEDGIRIGSDVLVSNSAISDLGGLIDDLAEARTRAACTAERMKCAGLTL